MQQPAVWQPCVDSRGKGSEVEAEEARRRLLERRGDEDEDDARARGDAGRSRAAADARVGGGSRATWSSARRAVGSGVGAIRTRARALSSASWLFLGGGVAAVDSHSCVQLCTQLCAGAKGFRQ